MKSYNSEDWIKKLAEDLPANYQVGLHEIGVFGTEESRREVRKNNILTYLRPINQKDFCKSIMKSGLKNRWERLGYTLMYFGSVEKIVDNREVNFRRDSFLGYDYNSKGSQLENQDFYDIVVSIPSHISIGEKKYFLGELSVAEENKDVERQRMESLFFKRDIPPEFIYRIYS